MNSVLTCIEQRRDSLPGLSVERSSALGCRTARPFGPRTADSGLPHTVIALLLFLTYATSSFAAAALNGTVTNGTTNKPAAGDEVVLIKLAAGMDEIGHTKTDAQGKFSFSFDNTRPHLVRVMHQGVTYHKPAPPGADSVQVEVYDVSPKVEGVHTVADLMYVQASQGILKIGRVFAVDNTSQPPRTQMNDHNFEFYLPEGAEIEETAAQTAGGQSVNVAPTPQAEKGRYALEFPLRPGQTQFQISYHLPYSGKATVDPHPIYPLQHFVAILPNSIAFTPVQPGTYDRRQPPDQPDAVAEIAGNVQPRQKLAFQISGEGVLKGGQEEQASNTGASANSGPGGGLGAPIDAPDPLDKYRGFILGGFGVILAGGAIYVVNRSRSVRRATAPAGASSATLLGALKDELFQLELEHKQGKISDQEYAQTKAALDHTLSRTIKRNS